MHWQKLDRDNSIKVIESVKSAENAGMFGTSTSEVEKGRLLFYKSYAIYKVTNFASIPSFTFNYLSDGTFFHYLDGTEDSIYTVNDKGDLALDRHNVISYLEFFFTHVGGDKGDIILISNPHDMPLLDSLDANAYDAVFSQHNPVEIHYDGGFDAYEISADLYKDSQVVRAQIEVSTKGRVTIKEQKMVMNEVTSNDYSDTVI